MCWIRSSWRGIGWSKKTLFIPLSISKIDRLARIRTAIVPSKN